VALIRLAYGQNFLEGADTLRVLVFGQIALAMFVIVATVLTSAGKPVLSAAIGLVALVIVLGANRLFVLGVGLGDATLGMAALATSLGTSVALLLSAIAMHKLFGVFLPLTTLVRCALSAGVAFVVAQQMPQSSALHAPLVMVVSGLVYLAACVITGELTRSDLEGALGSLKRKKAGPALGKA
jgi:O-antigen/teichoic acid export membrane protein